MVRGFRAAQSVIATAVKGLDLHELGRPQWSTIWGPAPTRRCRSMRSKRAAQAEPADAFPRVLNRAWNHRQTHKATLFPKSPSNFHANRPRRADFGYPCNPWVVPYLFCSPPAHDDVIHPRCGR
jgi:hypothetical protein